MLSNLSLPWWAYALMGAGLCVFIALIAITIHRNRGMHRSLFASPYALWMMIFTIVPVILIAYYAFTDSSGAFTLDNFRSFWDSNYESNKIILDAMGEAGQAYISRGTVNVDTLVYSLWMAFQCTVICLLLGYPLLTTHTAHLQLPLLGQVHVPSAVFFDLGVFAVVVGATLLILTALAHQSVRGYRQMADIATTDAAAAPESH